MSERVTCANCGFLNELGDEFCGDCGTYLAWSGTPDTGSASPGGPGLPAADAPGAGSPLPPPAPPTLLVPPSVAAGAGPALHAPAPSQPPYPQPQYPPQPQAQAPYPSAFQVMPPPAVGGQPCRNCGLANPPGRSFCQRCGQRLDPAVGTMAGSPRPAPSAAAATARSTSGGGGRRLAIAGIAAVFIAMVGGVALILSGVLGPNRAVSPTPLTAQASSTPGPTRHRTPRPTGAVTPEPTDQTTAEPTAEPAPTPTKTPKPTRKPTPSPPTPSQAPAPVVYVCDSSSAIPDPLSKGWNIRRVDWSNKGKYDRLIVTLDQKGAGGDGTQAIVHVVPPVEVPTSLKVSAPQAGTVAIALGMFQDVQLTWNLNRALMLPAIKWITMEKDNNGYPWVVLGVKGDGCYSLQVPDWSASDPQPATTVLVTIDVQH